MNRGSEKCRDCGTPLIDRENSREYKVIGLDRKKRTLKHDGNKLEVTCPKCGRIATFSTTEITKGLTYEVVKKKK